MAQTTQGALLVAAGSNSSTFSGRGAQGSFSLSHDAVLAGGEQPVFAELDLRADAADRARERAPLSIAVVLDTSGSMSGEKIAQAKDAVIALLRDLRDDDEVAFIRYSTDSELVQPLARAGAVRSSLINRVQAIEASGGTNIAPALTQGLRAQYADVSPDGKSIVFTVNGKGTTYLEIADLEEPERPSRHGLDALGKVQVGAAERVFVDLDRSRPAAQLSVDGAQPHGGLLGHLGPGKHLGDAVIALGGVGVAAEPLVAEGGIEGRGRHIRAVGKVHDQALVAGRSLGKAVAVHVLPALLEQRRGVIRLDLRPPFALAHLQRERLHLDAADLGGSLARIPQG